VELRQLEHFVVLAEEKHFTRAAKRAHIVQSGLSASIRALEAELGTKLFDRTTRRVELTEAGRAALVEARRALAAAAATRDAVMAVEGLERGQLSVGIMHTHGPLDLARILGRFHGRHPGIELRLRQADSEMLVELVLARTLDVAFVSLRDRAPTGLVATPLLREPLLMVCSAKHRLAGAKQVRLADIAVEDFIEGALEWSSRAIVDRVLARAGVERRVICEVNDTAALLDLVAHGLGIAVVPRPRMSRPGLRWIPLAGSVPPWEVSLLTADSGPLNPAARALVAAVRDDASEPAEAP
jgi:DNA-binding transcriptional LysR family regulator